MKKMMLAMLFVGVTVLATSPVALAGKAKIGNVITDTNTRSNPKISNKLKQKAMKGKSLTEGERVILRKAGLIDRQGNWIGDYPKISNKTRSQSGNRVDQGTVKPKTPKKKGSGPASELGSNPYAFIGGGAG